MLLESEQLHVYPSIGQYHSHVEASQGMLQPGGGKLGRVAAGHGLVGISRV